MGGGRGGDGRVGKTQKKSAQLNQAKKQCALRKFISKEDV